MEDRASIFNPPSSVLASRSDAFTLIELILAIGIMAIVMVAINSVFFSAMRLHESTVNLVDESLPTQQALSIMRRDLEGAMPPGTNGVLSGDFRVGGVTTMGVGMPVDIEMYTTTGALREDEPWGEVQKVTYGLRPAANFSQRGQDLYRSVTRNLLATVTTAPQDQWLLSGVQSIEFSCYDGSQWRSYWDTTSADTNLPTAIRVKLLLAGNADGSGSGRTIQMTVPIDSQSRTNQ